jgi:hypothetical protein
MKTNFWSLFKKMFNETSYCEQDVKKFKDDCHIISEKKEFKKLKYKFDSKWFTFNTKEWKAEYDRMRTLWKKYSLKYKI